MSDERWSHVVPMRVDELGHVILRTKNGGGYWVCLPAGTEVPIIDLDLRDNPSAEAPEEPNDEPAQPAAIARTNGHETR